VIPGAGKANIVGANNGLPGFALLAASLMATVQADAASKAWIPLGTTQGFAILSETGITDVPTSAIVGNVGVSPITGAANHLTCSEVKGRTFAVNAAGSACSVVAPSMLTTAISDMKAAYVDAASRIPAVRDLNVGNLGGMTLSPGVYAWSSGVIIPSTLTLQGSVSGKGNVWIFQVAKTLDLASGASVSLSRGASADFVFWQVAGAVTIGTGATFEGQILAKTSIAMKTGARLKGRMLAQSAVTLQANTITH